MAELPPLPQAFLDETERLVIQLREGKITPDEFLEKARALRERYARQAPAPSEAWEPAPSLTQQRIYSQSEIASMARRAKAL